jgi:glucuronate isomerase
MNPADPAWPARLDRLAEASGVDCGTHAGLLDALRARRAFAKSLGSTATDCGAVDAWAEPLDAPEAERIHREGLAGTASAADAAAYRRDLLYRFAEMAADDGLVMQLHTGVLRNHHAATLDRYGPDTGHDLPVASTFVEPLRRMLNDFGTNPAFRIVLFTVDETTFSREIAPLAGFYPSVYVGAPWWFLDAPAAIGRFRAAATETAGFRKTSGFIDDTRAFCSIPARHDMSRRADAAYLAGLVTTHQIDEADAHSLALDLVSAIPRETFRLGPESAP